MTKTRDENRSDSQNDSQKTSHNSAGESSRDFSKIKSLDDALRILDDAVATGHSDLKELVTEEYHNLKGAIAEIAPQLGHAIGEIRGEAMGQFTETVSDFTSDFAAKGQKYAQRGIEKGKRAAREIDNKVHENPWLVIGGVALGAFALGFFLGGRDRPRHAGPAHEEGDHAEEREHGEGADDAHPPRPRHRRPHHEPAHRTHAKKARRHTHADPADLEEQD